MNIHEYQAKQILKAYGIPILNGYLVTDSAQMTSQLAKISTPVSVVKAQIHAGGRGKAGGVKVTNSPSEALIAAEALLGKTLITHQTGPQGQMVRKLYVEEGCAIAREFYLSMVLDRASACVSIVASREGGMDIETVAEYNPNAILTINIDPLIGLKPFHITALIQCLNLTDAHRQQLQLIIMGMYICFQEKDLSMVEINPLVLTEEDKLIALDAKMSFDDNALFRHADIQALRDVDEEDAKEVAAAEHGMSYVALDGEIACLVNGAGLAMATMDAINFAGGKPANFLDVGGSASKEMVLKALEITLSDSNVKGIFINIFGGIMHCDTIATGIIEASQTLSRQVPLVVRLEGTAVEKGKQLLKASGLAITTADSMDEGAAKIVALVQAQEVTK